MEGKKYNVSDVIDFKSFDNFFIELNKDFKKLEEQLKSLGKIKSTGNGGDLEKINAQLKEQNLLYAKLLKSKTAIEKENKKQLADEKKIANEKKKIEKEQLATAKALDKQRQKALQKIAKEEHLQKEINNAMKKTAKSEKELAQITALLTKKLVTMNRTTTQGAKDYDNLSRKISKNNKELRRLGKTRQDDRRNVGNYSSAFGKMGSTISSVSPMMLGTAGAVAGLGMILKSGVEVMQEFEKTMSQVKAITGATGEDFDKLKEIAKKLGSTTVFSATEAASGMVALGQAGFTTNEIISALPGTLSLATAGNIDLASSADIVSNVMAGFGASASETNHYVDVLAKSANTANVTIPLMGESFKEIASTAKVMGVGVEEVGALINTLGNAGIKGTDATNSLQSSLLRLAKPTAKMKVEMKKAGLEVFDSNGEFIGLTNTIEQLTEKTKDYTTQEKLAAVGAIFGKNSANQWLTALSATKEILVSDLNPELKNLVDNQKIQTKETENGTVAILEGANVLKYYQNSLENSTGAADKMAKIMADNLAGDLKLLNSAWEGLILSIDDGDSSINNVLRSLTQFSSRILTSFTEGNALTDAYSDLWDVFKDLGSAINDIFEVFGELAESMGLTGEKIDWLSVLFEGLGFTLDLAMTPLKAIVWVFTNIIEAVGIVIDIIKDLANGDFSFAKTWNDILETLEKRFWALVDLIPIISDLWGSNSKEVEKLNDTYKDLTASVEQLTDDQRKSKIAYFEKIAVTRELTEAENDYLLVLKETNKINAITGLSLLQKQYQLEKLLELQKNNKLTDFGKKYLIELQAQIDNEIKAKEKLNKEINKLNKEKLANAKKYKDTLISDFAEKQKLEKAVLETEILSNEISYLNKKDIEKQKIEQSKKRLELEKKQILDLIEFEKKNKIEVKGSVTQERKNKITNIETQILDFDIPKDNSEKVKQAKIKELNELQKIQSANFEITKNREKEELILSNATAQEIADFDKKMEIQKTEIAILQMQERINLYKKLGNFSERELLVFEATIGALKVKLLELQTPENENSESFIENLLGLEEGDGDKLKESANKLLNSLSNAYSEHINRQIDLKQAQIDKSNDYINSLKSELEEENEKSKKGVANSKKEVEQKIAIEKKKNEELLKEQEKLARQKKLLATGEVIASTAVSAMKALEGPPYIKWIDFANVLAQGAIQLASINKVKFGDGGTIVQGKSHAEGGVNIEVEGGEMLGVLKKNKVPKYQDSFNSMVSQMNAGIYTPDFTQENLTIIDNSFLLSELQKSNISSQKTNNLLDLILNKPERFFENGILKTEILNNEINIFQ